MNARISPENIKKFETSYKVGLVSTIEANGVPHISLLSTLMAKSDRELMLGKFICGESKENVLREPKAGFLIMSLEKEFWMGKMTYTHTLTNGEDYELYNRQPLYRYNTYFGIDSVYYFDLLGISESRKLDMAGIVANSLRVSLLRGRFKRKLPQKAMKHWAYELMQKMGTLAFISFIDTDGYPTLVPCIQLQAADENTLVLSSSPYKTELAAIPAGARVAVFGANLKFESVLLKGVFSGFKGGVSTVEIDRVYNSMPPKHGYIFG
ncbi:MAG: hypothetical protein CVU91_12980 [Firmicutes bacterium HGW-Firmicutes-16]|nr:MAG: hypothetical protein CVU91_12980 [Firmicutes bacterium HGW-Firmicutes-16]